MGTPVPIDCTVLTGDELAAKIDEVENMPIPDPPTELTTKYRWVQCTIKNETQFPITLLSGAYLPSDTFWPAQPGDCAPFDQLVFSTYNDDRTNPAQANGAVFRLTLDHQDYASFYKVALGWTTPGSGVESAASVVQSSYPKPAADAVRPDNTSIISTVIFEGRSKEGTPVGLQFESSATPGQQTLFVIRQIRAY